MKLAHALITLLLIAGMTTSSGRADEPRSTIQYVQVDSPSLKRAVSVGVYLPAGYADSGDRRYSTLYFLHGMNGSEHQWQDRGASARLDALVAGKDVDPMIVVCPDGDNSFYLNWLNGKQDWEAFIVKDLVATIDKNYRTIPERRNRGLTGDSMGGYGALNLTFRNPTVFGSVSAHSAALFPEEIDKMPAWMKGPGGRFGEIFGDPPDIAYWKANNPLHLAATMDAMKLSSLSIYFDCGENDEYGFDAGAEALHRTLEKRDIPHEYHLRSGHHGRTYYIANVDFSLRFHAADFHRADVDNAAATERIEIAVTEKGFEPDHIHASRGKRTVLAFTRKIEATCAKAVVLTLGKGETIEKSLPLNEPVELVTVFSKPGDISFACKLGLFKGLVSVD